MKESVLLLLLSIPTARLLYVLKFLMLLRKCGFLKEREGNSYSMKGKERSTISGTPNRLSWMTFRRPAVGGDGGMPSAERSRQGRVKRCKDLAEEEERGGTRLHHDEEKRESPPSKEKSTSKILAALEEKTLLLLRGS